MAVVLAATIVIITSFFAIDELADPPAEGMSMTVKEMYLGYETPLKTEFRPTT